MRVRNRMNIWLFFMVLIISGLSTAATSSSNANFNIGGCTFNFQGSNISVASGTCSGGTANGLFYCGAGATPWITSVAGQGCSMGDSNYVSGDNFCCPSNMFCNKTTNGLFKCEDRLTSCVNQTNKPDCNADGCIWMNITGECSGNPRGEYGCDYYNTESSCTADEWGIGVSGVGTASCGTIINCAGETFSIPASECGCQWYPNAPAGDKCQLKMSAVEFISGGAPDKFECSNIYNLGNCTGGVQNVTWSSHSKVISGFNSSGIPTECLNALNCNGGESTRFCGEPIIKLPWFSLLSLFTSLFIIGTYYLLSDKFKYRKSVKI